MCGCNKRNANLKQPRMPKPKVIKKPEKIIRTKKLPKM